MWGNCDKEGLIASHKKFMRDLQGMKNQKPTHQSSSPHFAFHSYPWQHPSISPQPPIPFPFIPSIDMVDYSLSNGVRYGSLVVCAHYAIGVLKSPLYVWMAWMLTLAYANRKTLCGTYKKDVVSHKCERHQEVKSSSLWSYKSQWIGSSWVFFSCFKHKVFF